MSILSPTTDSFIVDEGARTVNLNIGNLQSSVKVKQLLLVLGNCKSEFFNSRKITNISMIIFDNRRKKLVIQNTNQDRILQVLTNIYLFKNDRRQKAHALERLATLFSNIFEFYTDDENGLHSYLEILKNPISSILFIFTISARDFNHNYIVRNLLNAHKRYINKIPLNMTLKNILDIDSLVPEEPEDVEDHEIYDYLVNEAIENNSINSVAALNSDDFPLPFDEEEESFFRNLYTHNIIDNELQSDQPTTSKKGHGRKRYYDEIHTLARGVFSAARDIAKKLRPG